MRGLTPYHAIKLALPQLAGGGKHALVIGLGGLGQLGVQILKALTGATIIATDMKEDAMAEAEAAGAITVPGGPDQVEQIRELTGGKGVDAAFDFVGVAGTVNVAMNSMAVQGRCTIVGIAGGTYEWSFFTNPYEATSHEHLLGHDRRASRGRRLYQGRSDRARRRTILAGERSRRLPEDGGRRAVWPCSDRAAQRLSGTVRNSGPGRRIGPAIQGPDHARPSYIMNDVRRTAA